jgi:hypothetical protein
MRGISDVCSQSVENQNRDLGLNRKAPSLFYSWACISTFRAAVCFILALTLACPAPVRAYAVLSHEAIIDAVWETHIKPLLPKKFPHSTDEQLSEAQSDKLRIPKLWSGLSRAPLSDRRFLLHQSNVTTMRSWGLVGPIDSELIR